MKARDVRAGDFEMLVGDLYRDVLRAEPTTWEDRPAVRLVVDLSADAPRDPLTGERVDWTRYEVIYRPSENVRGRRAERSLDPHSLRAGDSLRATGHMTPRCGGRILADRPLTVASADRGVFVIRDEATGQRYPMTAPEVAHGAGPGHRLVRA